MEREIPKFIYHGTTNRAYTNMGMGGLNICGELQCSSNVDEAIGFARKRARQRQDDPILLVIESGKHDVRKDLSEYLVSGNLNPDGHLSIPVCDALDEKRFVEQYYFLMNKQHSAKSLEDFKRLE